jgi:transcriptional regulator with XRE-family HTH domain
MTASCQGAAVDLRFGRSIRALRLRRGWRQLDLGRAANVSRSFVSKVELGDIETVSVGSLRDLAAALGASLDMRIRWRGEGLDRLLDEAHSALVDAAVLLLQAAGWEVAVEVSFSISGERGSIDILAFHRGTGILLVIEVKSVVPDSQATIYGLDRKARLAVQIAAERGWVCREVARLLIIGDSTTARRRVGRFASMYASALPARGAEVRRWLRRPSGPMAGILFLPDATRDGVNRRQPGRERVRRPNLPQTTPAVAHGAGGRRSEDRMGITTPPVESGRRGAA